MSEVSPESLKRWLERGERGGVFFLHGEEDYLKEELAAALVDAHVGSGARDFNLDQLRGTEVSPETLASILQTPPMMAEWRVVVVRDAQGLAGSSTARGVVEQVLERPVPGLALVLIAQIPDGSRARFYTTLKKKAVSVSLAPLSDADVPGWLMARARARGLTLEVDAAQAMAAAIGSNLGVLSSELAKLRDYVGDRDAIRREDVEHVVGVVPRVNRWEWLDRVADGRFAEARRDLGTLLATDSGVGLVLALGAHFLRMALFRAGGSAALEAELPPRQRWLARKLAGQARRWTPDALAGALDDLLRADRLLKSAPLGDDQVMDELLLRMQHRTSRGAAA
ncbi:MAG TPA: DNA polymerase III subunit delta [Longimicrobiales bacterium]|nr:DNA polymerase III subunit delta [Longimicrobiales bacterium]